MNTFKRRLLSAIIMVASGACFAVAQTNIVKHVVDRGETLASIAKRYATTEAKIIELNPDAAQFVYVGMELKIPVEKVNDVVKEDNPKTLNNGISDTSVQFETDIKSKNQPFPRWTGTASIAYGLIPKPKGSDVSGSSFAYSMSIGANYTVDNSLYIGARLGYGLTNTCLLMHLGVAQYESVTIENHMVVLPIEIGYNWPLIKDKFELIPYGGVDLNYCVKSTKKEGVGSNATKESYKPKDRLGVNGRIGLRLNLYGFYLGGSYVFSFDKNFGENDGYPEISIGMTF